MRTLQVLLVAAFVAIALPLHAQVTPPTVIPKTFGVGPYMVNLDDADLYDKPSNGLPNVAPNTKVYMMISGKYSDDGEAWASSTWTFSSVPAGSAAAIETIDDLRACFVPDVKGTYVIDVTGTDDQSETGTATLTINVADYVGVGGFVEGTTGAPPQCGVCHSAVKNKWLTTGHATAFMRKIDEEGGHFGSNCATCHVTGSTDPTEMGGGYLQLAASTSWEWPEHNGPGNFQSLIDAEPDMAQMATISCENCHGPGSAHNAVVSDNKIVTQTSSEACIQCHDAPTHHMKFREFAVSGHAIAVGEPDNPWHMNRGSKTNEHSDCARCHTSAGYLDVMEQVAGGKAYNESFTNAPYDDPGYVGCVTCHNPHDATHEYQLRQDMRDLCAGCHHIRLSGHSGLHHSHQGSMLDGVDGKEFPGYTYRNSGHSYNPEGCAACHMAPPQAEYADHLGGHTFHIIYDNGTPDDNSDDVLNSSGCAECHSTQATLEYVEETQDEIHMLLDELQSILIYHRADGTPVYPQDDTLKTTLEQDLHFNWYYVANDASYGVHNKKYSVDLLTATIAEAKALYQTAVEPIGAASEYAMQQNYPNPFNPSTMIEFSVPKAANVVIDIYDAQGALVYKLVNGTYAPGTYRVNWNGTIYDANTVAPAGVYFYRIQAGDFTTTKKMLLMK